MRSKRKLGRPTTYSQEVADEICRRLAEGETLSAICRSEGMPARTTFLQWVRDNRDGLSDKYARARELGLEAMADELIEIEDGGSDDWQRDRLRVDARKWMLARLLAHKYGDRVTLAGDAAAPLGVVLLPEVRGGADDDDDEEDASAGAGAHIRGSAAADDDTGAAGDAW